MKIEKLTAGQEVFDCHKHRMEELERENAELREALDMLVGTIRAHEIESLSCDRDGETYCDCLEKSADKARELLSRTAQGKEHG